MWAILQTAVAAGLAWWLTRDVLGHAQPFFAPIAAAVCLWATNVVRAEIAGDLVIGVAAGIAIGTGVNAVLGDGAIAMTVVVLLALWVAVTIAQAFAAQRPTFVNQTVISAILILTFPHSGFGVERFFDALIGGGVAVVFSIVLFPKNPLTMLDRARQGVLLDVRDILNRIGDDDAPTSGWVVVAARRLHRRLALLGDARSTARQLVRLCPRRWSLRGATRIADGQSAQLALLATSVLQLARIATTSTDPLDESLRTAITILGEAVAALADDEPAAAATRVASIHADIAALAPACGAGTRGQLAAMLHACATELQQAVGLPTP